MYDKHLMNELANKMAQFHALKPPMNKKKNWIISFFTEDSQEFYENQYLAKRELFGRMNCKTLLECDIENELQWIADRIPGFGSPTVFAHNDFRKGNILLTEDNGPLLSDFDYSCYGYRGFDFGSFFIGFESIVDNTIGFKDESVVREVIASYVKQCEQIYGTEYSLKECNSMDSMIKEIKLFLMVYQIFVVKGFLIYSTTFMSEEKTMVNFISFCFYLSC